MGRERHIGEVFGVDGVEVVVVPDVEGADNCLFCEFCEACVSLRHPADDLGACSAYFRKDCTDVHFERYNDGHHLTRHLDEDKKSPVATDREQ